MWETCFNMLVAISMSQFTQQQIFKKKMKYESFVLKYDHYLFYIMMIHTLDFNYEQNRNKVKKCQWSHRQPLVSLTHRHLLVKWSVFLCCRSLWSNFVFWPRNLQTMFQTHICKIAICENAATVVRQV